MTDLPSDTSPISRLELIALAVGAGLLFLVHWHFKLSGFGEQDAARLATDAITWHVQRTIDMTQVDYRLHTSPLYIHALKSLLDRGLALRSLPLVMNGFSVFMSSACSVGLYLLFRRLATPWIACAATLVYALTPAFWLGSVYGMPTLPSLTLLVFAALVFARAADLEHWRSAEFAGFVALATLLTCLSFALKADMALSSGALLVVLLARGRFWRPVLLGCIVFIVGVGTLFTMVYARSLSVPAPAVADKQTHAVSGFLSSWNGRFPFHWDLLLDPKNNAPISHAVGSILFGVCLLALLQGVLSGGRRARITWGAALWGLGPLLFWGLKPGNSARHNLPAFPPLVFLAVAMVFQLVRNNTRRAWLALALLLLLGQLDETGSGSVNPRVAVLTATEQVEGSTSSLHARAREFVRSSNPKKAIIEGEYLLAFSEFEAWAGTEKPKLLGEPRTISGGPDQEIRIIEVSGARAAKGQAQRLRSEGYAVFSLQFSL